MSPTQTLLCSSCLGTVVSSLTENPNKSKKVSQKSPWVYPKPFTSLSGSGTWGVPNSLGFGVQGLGSTVGGLGAFFGGSPHNKVYSMLGSMIIVVHLFMETMT